MRRLRLRCPLCGYWKRVVIIVIPIASMLAFDILDVTSPEVEFHDIIIHIILLSALFFFIAHLWLYRTKRKERELIKGAEKIYWRELSTDEENQAKLSAKPDYLGFIVAAIIIACVFLGYAIALNFQLASDIVITALIAALLSFIYLLTGIVHYKKWQKIDNTARCTIFPIHHTYAMKTGSEFFPSYNYYHVIYTPVGKLVLKSSNTTFSSKQKNPDVKEIRIFEYKNMLTYAEY